MSGRGMIRSSRPIRRGSKRKERLLHAQRAMIVQRPLVLPEGADEELGKLFGIGGDDAE